MAVLPHTTEETLCPIDPTFTEIAVAVILHGESPGSIGIIEVIATGIGPVLSSKIKVSWEALIPHHTLHRAGSQVSGELVTAAGKILVFGLGDQKFNTIENSRDVWQGATAVSVCHSSPIKKRRVRSAAASMGVPMVSRHIERGNYALARTKKWRITVSVP